jgi:hypothetical protein
MRFVRAFYSGIGQASINPRNQHIYVKNKGMGEMDVVHFLLITFVVLAVISGFCLLVGIGLRKDTVHYDMVYLWDHYGVSLGEMNFHPGPGKR